MLTNEKITFNTLLPHMIKYHHFFESPNVSHHVGPEKVIRLFNLVPGGKLTTYKIKTCWTEDHSGSIDQKLVFYIRLLECLSVDKYETEEFKAYLVPFKFETFIPVGKDTYRNIRRKMLKKKDNIDEIIQCEEALISKYKEDHSLKMIINNKTFEMSVVVIQCKEFDSEEPRKFTFGNVEGFIDDMDGEYISHYELTDISIPED